MPRPEAAEVQQVSDAQEAQAPARLEDLKRKTKLVGKVKKVELFGAFVDVVKEGDEITVWVRKVDPQAGRIDLTLIEPLGVEWDELKAGQVHNGRVIKLEKFGAFVDIGAERPGLVHISELATHRVDDVSEIVKVGDEIPVKVLAIDSRKKQIKLSIKAVEEAREEEPEQPDEAPRTAMQAAMERAMQQARAERRASARRGKGKAERGRQDLEDILSRTLANKRK
jgi:small subunit ribosomal protein S1